MGYPIELDDFESSIRIERGAQDRKWGEQNHPNGTGSIQWKQRADLAKQYCDSVFKNHCGTWLDILKEEIYEAFAEQDPLKLRAELIQCAAVIKAWIEAIDRKELNIK